MLVAILLIVGIALWYVYFGFECFVDGRDAFGRSPWLMQFVCLWEELTWVLPGGTARKFRVALGNPFIVSTMPGLLHFLLVHVVLPFGPAAIAWALS